MPPKALIKSRLCRQWEVPLLLPTAAAYVLSVREFPSASIIVGCFSVIEHDQASHRSASSFQGDNSTELYVASPLYAGISLRTRRTPEPMARRWSFRTRLYTAGCTTLINDSSKHTRRPGDGLLSALYTLVLLAPSIMPIQTL
ncbi:hypothetical protein BC834DRAFT_870244 [Gloeopeniophorella convolvens]|nr:hypothetical protein BC834DRAFT_870244 [Gloeopeniophorella convolvens]